MRRRYALAPFCALTILSLCLLLPGLHAKNEKLQVGDIVARHLASIGTTEARAAVQNRAVSGTVLMTHQLGGTGQFSGLINIISEDRKVRLGMNFETLTYYSDQFAFDGEKVAVDQFRPGARSTLSQFFYDHDVIIKEGLLGGTLSTAWPLLDLKARQPKLDYTGLKTIEGKKLHEIEYRAKKGGGDVLIYLYFDPENFRHVRTRYRLEKPDAALSGTMSGQAREMTIYTLIEQFDNFVAIDGLTLPQMYKLQLNIQGPRETIMHDWDAAISQTIQNQQIDPKYFTIH